MQLPQCAAKRENRENCGPETETVKKMDEMGAREQGPRQMRSKATRKAITLLDTRPKHGKLREMK